MTRNPEYRNKRIARMLLGAILVFAGIGHISFARTTFQAQVPTWVRVDADLVVMLSGLVEIALGAGLLVIRRRRAEMGLVVAAFFVAIFRGNISQFVTHSDAFGLNSDASRGIRLLFQPLLVAWAWWSTRS